MRPTERLRKRRIIAYALLTISIGYLTFLVIVDTHVENFKLGKIDFSKDEVNNYSTLIGALVGVFGVVLLIETLWLQFKQYNDDKHEKIKEERLDLLYRLKLFTIDLETVKEDFVSKFEKIEVYYKAELKNPFTGHVLRRTSSGYFSRIHQIGRITLYQAFALFVQTKNDNWIKEFNDIYKILDFLDDFYCDMYSKYEAHSKEQVERRMNIRTSLNDLMNEATNFLGTKERELGSTESASKNSEWQLVNQLILLFQDQLINPEIDEDGNKQTSYQKIKDQVLTVFILELLAYREKIGYLTHDLDRFIGKAANINREIELHRDKSIEFAFNLGQNHISLAISSDSNKSIDKQLEDLIEMLKPCITQ
jgi:hypothetical protein